MVDGGKDSLHGFDRWWGRRKLRPLVVSTHETGGSNWAEVPRISQGRTKKNGSRLTGVSGTQGAHPLEGWSGNWSPPGGVGNRLSWWRGARCHWAALAMGR